MDLASGFGCGWSATLLAENYLLRVARYLILKGESSPQAFRKHESCILSKDLEHSANQAGVTIDSLVVRLSSLVLIFHLKSVQVQHGTHTTPLHAFVGPYSLSSSRRKSGRQFTAYPINAPRTAQSHSLLARGRKEMRQILGRVLVWRQIPATTPTIVGYRGLVSA